MEAWGGGPGASGGNPCVGGRGPASSSQGGCGVAVDMGIRLEGQVPQGRGGSGSSSEAGAPWGAGGSRDAAAEGQDLCTCVYGPEAEFCSGGRPASSGESVCRPRDLLEGRKEDTYSEGGQEQGSRLGFPFKGAGHVGWGHLGGVSCRVKEEVGLPHSLRKG